jgi:hypothetical protein
LINTVIVFPFRRLFLIQFPKRTLYEENIINVLYLLGCH